MIYIQHQIDRLRQEMEKNAAENNEFKTLMRKTLAVEQTHKRQEAQIIYEKIIVLEKENQCLKNGVKNQQAVIEMLITENKCGNK